LIPLVTQVREVSPLTHGGFAVWLTHSDSRHTIAATEPEQGPLVGLLREALSTGMYLVVTSHPLHHQIIDVRPSATKPADAPTTGERLPKDLSAVDERDAIHIFNSLLTRNCPIPAKPCGVAPTPDCIPFAYPDNGCWARAHRMCQLIEESNLLTGKLWLFGKREVPTRYSPCCRVLWGKHVAPVLRRKDGAPDDLWVFDPGLFGGPTSPREWIAIQRGDPAKALLSASWIYLMQEPKPGAEPSEWDATPDRKNETMDTLRIFHADLLLRSCEDGLPPYSHCIR
jgi:hypothetical protein